MKFLLSCFLFFQSCIIIFAQNPDIRLLEKINLQRNPQLDHTFKAISNTTGLISFGVPVGIYSYSLFVDDKITQKKGLFLIETAVVNTLITTAMKYSIQRERPFVTYPQLIPLDKGGSPSFPSGHTSDAFALATSLTMAYNTWYVAIPSYAWATSVGYSRMHLGVHYPSDVLAGAIVGTCSAWLSSYLNKKVFRRKVLIK